MTSHRERHDPISVVARAEAALSSGTLATVDRDRVTEGLVALRRLDRAPCLRVRVACPCGSEAVRDASLAEWDGDRLLLSVACHECGASA